MRINFECVRTSVIYSYNSTILISLLKSYRLDHFFVHLAYLCCNINGIQNLIIIIVRGKEK